MPLTVVCPSCKVRLRVPPTAEGRRLQCPKCSQPFAVPKPAAGAATEVASGSRNQQSPAPAPRRQPPLEAATGPSRRDPDSDEPVVVRRKRRPPEDDAALEEVSAVDNDEPVVVRRKRRPPEDDAALEEVSPVDSDEVVVVRRRQGRPPAENGPRKRARRDDVDPEDEPPGRRKKKKRRQPRPRPADDEAGSLAWVWWAGGSGFVALTLMALLAIAVFSPLESKWKFDSIYLLVSLPLGTVLFFIAMFVSSTLLGALDIGEIHVAAFKAYILVFLANLAGLVPFFGWGLALLVWLAGSMTLFRLDFWEARMLIFINWLLNLGLRFLLFMAVMSWLTHGGGSSGEVDHPPSGSNVPEQHNTWDESDILDRNGTVEYDQTRRDVAVVVGISFRQAPIDDADLAHIKDFPQLLKLDLTGTPITDEGLKHLSACPQLQRLILTGTQVTDAGVADLRQALPGLQIERL